jgi:hypothetical protein
MLEQIFGSKTRTRLLKLFLLNPEKVYFIRELTRLIDTQINSVRRELQNLLQCKLIQEVNAAELEKELQRAEETPTNSKKQKNLERLAKKYFQANTDYLLFRELRAIFLRGPFLHQDDLVRDIRSLEHLDMAVLSGFFVDNDDSHVDLLIVGNVNRTKLTKIIHGFEKVFEKEINYTTLTKDEYLYRHSLSDRFLFGVLEGKNKIIIDNIHGKPSAFSM